MAHLRHVLSRIAIVWLFCHAATVTAATSALWSSHAGGVLECTCGHGEHAVCPMHHKPVPGAKKCLLKSVDDTGSAMLGSLFSMPGVAGTSAESSAPEPARAIPLVEPFRDSLRPLPPDPPPPRV